MQLMASIMMGLIHCCKALRARRSLHLASMPLHGVMREIVGRDLQLSRGQADCGRGEAAGSAVPSAWPGCNRGPGDPPTLGWSQHADGSERMDVGAQRGAQLSRSSAPAHLQCLRPSQSALCCLRAQREEEERLRREEEEKNKKKKGKGKGKGKKK